MTTTPITQPVTLPWCTPHRHTQRCWWNWEAARWVCPIAAPTTRQEPK